LIRARDFRLSLKRGASELKQQVTATSLGSIPEATPEQSLEATPEQSLEATPAE